MRSDEGLVHIRSISMIERTSATAVLVDIRLKFSFPFISGMTIRLTREYPQSTRACALLSACRPLVVDVGEGALFWSAVYCWRGCLGEGDSE
ncbi:MAG: hypothetical protein QOE55_8555 [Acidobacteriaceae bacterium]|jgi:hypothetical protein|nr:hypothetical protein [Acidobacteriaceae bacterium]